MFFTLSVFAVAAYEVEPVEETETEQIIDKREFCTFIVKISRKCLIFAEEFDQKFCEQHYDETAKTCVAQQIKYIENWFKCMDANSCNKSTCKPVGEKMSKNYEICNLFRGGESRHEPDMAQ